MVELSMHQPLLGGTAKSQFTDKPRLWTEAICINQEDLAERGNQLYQFRGIYQGADDLLVWFGNTENNSNLVFEHLDRCRSYDHINWCHYNRGEPEEPAFTV